MSTPTTAGRTASRNEQDRLVQHLILRSRAVNLNRVAAALDRLVEKDDQVVYDVLTPSAWDLREKDVLAIFAAIDDLKALVEEYRLSDIRGPITADRIAAR